MRHEVFWEEQHLANEITALTYTPPEAVLQLHALDIPSTTIDVLDIGVGNGDMSRYLADRFHRVHCLDVCHAALEKVDVRASRHLVRLDPPPPPVDLAVAHLVAQHNDDEDMAATLRRVRLKSGGRISVQFLDGNIVEPGIPLYSRSDGESAALIEASGFTVVSVSAVATGTYGSPTRPWRWNVVLATA
jgi:SAM-dependent methyltransferase